MSDDDPGPNTDGADAAGGTAEPGAAAGAPRPEPSRAHADDHSPVRNFYLAGTLAVLSTIALVVLTGWALTTPVDDPPGTLRVLTGNDASKAPVLYQELIEAWNAENEEYPAELVEVSAGADMQHAEMVRSTQGGAAAYDVINLDNQWIAEFARAERITPLSKAGGGSAGEGFLDSTIEAVEYNGEQWAVPFVADVGLLYFRSDLVDRADLEGKDWPEVYETLRDTAREHGDEVDHAYAGQFARYEGLTVNAMEFAWGESAAAGARSGGLVDGDGGVGLGAEPVRRGLRRIAEGLNDGTLPANSLTAQETAARQSFVDGDVLAMRNWPVQYDQLLSATAEEDRTRDPEGVAAHAGSGRPGADIEFGVMALPDGMSVLGGQSLAIAEGSPRQRKARDLIEFLTRPEHQRRLFHCGGYAPTRAGGYSGSVEGACPGVPGSAGGRSDIEDKYDGDRGDTRYVPRLRDAIEAARPRPVTPNYAMFTDAFTGGFHPVLAEHASAAEFDAELFDAQLDELRPPLRSALDGQGPP
ncbi:carbohydrate ABC transporter substrate-binding protein (CUT1 family) [Murinocardiopsis flavida]|uniref:Carbohydrate ABC transporter substrate-binding protein (CUT1 family) n=1 Tax=Murinocardiopsis flavida TaxID=645275 RepID=A0A2P8CW49_9ACTN|nr:extracellular solute-binding protein [Murinocardiopsis flavida]PSK89159.1 carbohydrate ABC transporter substrate-binding protein (CUT1 family) [Murinocardiopsis flavida]